MNVDVVTVPEMLIAAVRRQAFPSTLSGLIANSSVWDLMAERGITSTGRNVVAYWDEDDDGLFSDDGVKVHIGAEITARFAGDPSLQCVTLPQGRAARAEHFGPYSRLWDAHHAVRVWCRQNGHEIAGPNWEIYGHWSEDPSKLQTDICYLLADG